MKKFYAICGLLFASLSAMAIDPPQIPAQELVDGGKYVFVNKAAVAPAMYRTYWDGAFFYGAVEGSASAVSGSTYFDNQLEAVKNDDGTWSFIITTPSTEEGVEPTTSYLSITTNTGNVNMSSDYASWYVEAGSYDKSYRLTPCDGSMAGATGSYLHLNKNNDYIIISYYGSDFYPDFALKTSYDIDGNELYAYMNNGVEDWWNGTARDCEHLVMADSASLDWAFVNAASIETYAASLKAYKTIVDCDSNYSTVEGFETGFKLSIDAASAIYEAEDFNIDDVDVIKAIIDAKVAFYADVVNAIEQNVTEDEVLAGAIDNAVSIFNATSDTTDIKNARATLSDALKNYLLGGSDFTFLGQNMSFEDLSSQNGNTTTGLAAPPTGWNLYLGGVKVTTADEVRSAGVANWCGINADCVGETKDGNYGFGIWTGGFPEVELSQTIEGLENGTYEVSAALMVGANGNGSRRTTQRIFGNLNSTYFASEVEYDLSLLDKSEVYGFADLIEPVTDTEMQPISVRAYVYDGTLTIGLRTDGNIAAALRTYGNSAGGDGWFKVDNFRITKVGYSADDAMAVLAHYVNYLDEYHSMDMPMAAATSALLKEKIESLSAITSDNTPAEIDAAIVEAKNLLVVVDASVKNYEKLYVAIEEHWISADEFSHMPGVGDYTDYIQEVEDNYIDGVYADDQVDAIIASLDDALENCKKSEILVGKNITYVLKNPSFEDWTTTQTNDGSGGVENAPKGWNLIINGDTCVTRGDVTTNGISAWCAINRGDGINVELEDGTIVTMQPTEGEHLWGIWNSNIPEVELSQVLTGIPAGTYTVTADVMVQNNWAGDNLTTQRIFANQSIQMFGSEEAHALNLPEDAQAAAAWDAANPDAENKFLTYAGYTCESGDRTTDLLHTMTVTFGVDESGIAKIGFRTNGINTDGLTWAEGGREGQGWFKVDNFTLTYDSEEIPTAIGSVKAEGGSTTIASRQFYTVDGVKVVAPQKGINIVKNIMSDGTVKVCKMIVK